MECIRVSHPSSTNYLALGNRQPFTVNILSHPLSGLSFLHSSVVYFTFSPRGQQFCNSPAAKFDLRVPKRRDDEATTRATATTSLARKSIPEGNAGGWIDTSTARKKAPAAKKRTTTKKPASSKTTTAAAKKRKVTNTKVARPKKRASTSNVATAAKASSSGIANKKRRASLPATSIEVIECDDSSEASTTETPLIRKTPLRQGSSEATSYKAAPDDGDHGLWDDDSENEFE
jgi:hypothetical protein